MTYSHILGDSVTVVYPPFPLRGGTIVDTVGGGKAHHITSFGIFGRLAASVGIAARPARDTIILSERPFVAWRG
jgi:hypothetical protein